MEPDWTKKNKLFFFFFLCLIIIFVIKKREVYIPDYANSEYLHFEELLYSMIYESAKLDLGLEKGFLQPSLNS